MSGHSREQLERAAEVLDAVRLAAAGASTDNAAMKVIRALLEESEDLLDPEGTASVERFLRAVRTADGKLEVAA